MQNFIQNGHIVRVTAPSGEGLMVGSLFSIAAHSSTEGDPVELGTTGVYHLPKASAVVLTVGARGVG